MTENTETMEFDEKTLDELIRCKTQEDLFGKNGIIKQFVKAISERAMKGELTTHLGYQKHFRWMWHQTK